MTSSSITYHLTTTDNSDRLFIVPAPAILPTHEKILREHVNEVNVISLNQFSTQEAFEHKAILKVHGHELGSLIDTIFATKKSNIKFTIISTDTNFLC